MAIFRVPVTITFPGAGSPGANIWHIRTGGTLPADELTQANALIGYIRTFYSSMNSYLPAATVCTLGTVTEEGTSREIVPTFASVTGVGVASAPQMLALVITWKTSIASRRGRGRTFFGPLPTAAMQNDGTPVAALVSLAQSSAATLISSSAAYGNGAIGVWGYQNAKLPGKANPRNPADPKVFRDFVSYNVRDIFGVLRSRRD